MLVALRSHDGVKGPTPVSVLVALGAMTEVKGSTPVQGIGGVWGGGHDRSEGNQI